MVNLKSYFGEKIFDRKAAYKKPIYLPHIISICLDLMAAVIIVKIFDIKQDYAILKVFGLLFVIVFVKTLLEVPIKKIFYKSYFVGPMASEMNHYLRVIDMNIDEYNSYAYEDYLGWAALNPTLDPDIRVLAGINYGVVVDMMASNPDMETIINYTWAETLLKYKNDYPKKCLSF
jgi:hypothetical protein